MKNIFTIVYAEEKANEASRFIMSKRHEGVQNDSYRYCREMIRRCITENKRHDINYIYVGTSGPQMIVSVTKRRLKRKGPTYIEKKIKFHELLNRYR